MDPRQIDHDNAEPARALLTAAALRGSRGIYVFGSGEHPATPRLLLIGWLYRKKIRLTERYHGWLFFEELTINERVVLKQNFPQTLAAFSPF